jgi:rhodanese-related sulfurtransferase
MATAPVSCFVNEIDADELADRRGEDGEVRIVDIRPPAAFRTGHIPGSENVPMNQLPDRAEELDGADTVVTVCPHGEASLQAARLLGAYEGLSDAEIYSLAGGLTAWDRELEAADAAVEPVGDSTAVDSGSGQSDAPF